MSAITAKASRKMKKYAVLTREPRCFLGSFDFSWEQRKLGELVDRVVRKNTNNESTLPLTISAQYGLVDQITYFNNRVASRDVSNYYLVLNGEFAYNKSTSDGYPFGAVKRLDLYEKGVLSTLYIVFAPKKEQQIDSDYLTVFFDTDRWHKGVAERAAEGARNHGLLNISAEDFFDIDLSVPKDIVEQKQIGAFIRQLDNLITLHQRKCALLFSPFQAFISMMFITSTFSWEQRKLSEITDKVTEKNAGLQYVETFTNSAEFGIISQRDFFDHDIAKLGSLDGYYIVKTEDFVYNPRISTSAPVGPINRNKLGRTGVMSPLYTVFRPHDIDTTYLEYFFKCGYWHSFMNFNGDSGARSDRFSIRDNVFFQMPIPIPDIDEQRKIGELLTCLDNLITLHQRKCIFFTGRAGRLISTVNKKRITSSWEQREVGDLLIERSQQAPMSDEYPLMAFIANEGVAPKGERYDRSALVTDTVNKLYKKTEKGDFIYSSNNLETGSIGLNKYGKACISPVYSIFEPTGIADSDFLGRRLVRKDFINAMVKWRQGVIYGQWRIHESDFLKIEISVPSVEEQRKIGAYLDQLDNLITLHQRKCIFFTGRAGRLISTVNKKRITSSWEQREVGDLLIERSQQAPMSDEYPLMAFIANEGVAPKGERYDRSALVTDTVNKLYKKTEKGDFIYSSNNLETGSIGLNKYGKACISPVYSIFEPTGIADSDFLGRRLVRKDFINAMVKWRQGVIYGQWRIHESDFLKIEISVPSVEEQRKIGAYLDQLDNLITLHQRKPFLMKWRTSDANRNQTNRLVL